eukprot:GHRR01010054.1.p1 GENE.GHRR01010054.1~~GHRR01010054.1.p1  ORF type:complete len:356 (+),score=108.71 GHRR01010054.1:657-1724(+)
MHREVRRFKAQHIRTGTALGELNHPSYSSTYFRSLNLPNISHQVLDVFWRGTELWGTIEVLPTPAGLLLWELYSKGIKLGVSSRGWASVVTHPKTQQLMVDNDFQLITFDFVTEPSNAGAFLIPVCKPYRSKVPDQSAAVRMSFLGFGSADMSCLGQLPAPQQLISWFKQTRGTMAGATGTELSTSQASDRPPFPPPKHSLQQPSAAALVCGADASIESNTAGTNDNNGCAIFAESAGSSSMLRTLGGQRRAELLSARMRLGGGVVLGCHYRVLPEPWMPVDPAGREFRTHLSLIATKAHLMQQKLKLSGPGSAAQHRQQEQHQPAIDAVHAAVVAAEEAVKSARQGQHQRKRKL